MHQVTQRSGDLLGHAAASCDKEEGSRLPLLIADDDLTTRTMLSAVIHKWGYDTIVADNGEAAWQIMQREDAPRLLLLDWMMPGLDGLALCRRIRQHETNDPPYIILLTARNETDDIVTGLDAGANDYIAKPYDNAELQARLQVGRRILELQSELIRNAEQLQLAASVFTHAQEGITITDLDGTIIEVNEAFSRITGYSRDEAVGRNPRILKSGHQGKAFYAAMWHDLTTKGHWYGEIWNRRKNGEVYAEILNISAVRDAQGSSRHYIALFSDITAQKEHQKQLEHIAHYDALTGLPNRVLLADRLHQAMAQTQRHGQRLAVAYLDLDGFKAINDTHGHDIGDRLLMALAIHMKQALREGDTIARLGGDEFVAVLNDLDDTVDCIPMLTRLLDAAAQPVQINNHLLQVSASLGVTIYPQGDEIDPDQLLRQADQAMYQAKLSGKNRYHIFDAEQDRNIRGQHESLERIRRALVQNEFVLYYQPKVNMRSGEIIGAEALIRWQHPEEGLLSPAAFLPAIEGHPFSTELGEWVIDTALTQMEIWQRDGISIPVSVNVGAFQLQQADFTDRLRRLVAAHPTIQPGNLVLEVLETSALEDIDHVSRVMHECAVIGVNFALDDFGTGYSSLTYLKRLPVNEIKIDKSFVHDMLDEPDDLTILEGILGLATAFRRQAIAEGVETPAHGKMLLQLGCELAQGYAIAHPMPAAEMPDWMTNWQPDPSWAGLRRVSHDLQPLLLADAEQRAWNRAIEAWIKGKTATPPPLRPQQCRFGQWLESTGRRHHDTHPAFQTIVTLHQKAHAIAADLVDLKTQGRRQEALASLRQLHNIGDDLARQIQTVIDETASEP